MVMISRMKILLKELKKFNKTNITFNFEDEIIEI